MAEYQCAPPVFSESGKIRRVLLTLNDITDLRERPYEVSRLATHDSLTGTFNKDVITHLLENEIRRAQGYGTVFTIAQLDIDLFSALCETHGKSNGDSVLASIGKILCEGVREIDMVGRIGYDEFLVVLPKARLSDAVIGMERLRSTIEDRAFTPDDLHLHVTTCGGMAECAGETSAKLLETVNHYSSMQENRVENAFCIDPKIF